VLCFDHHTPDDVLIGETKICGSAQRKRRGALLQHGSILLAASAMTPELPGIAELTGHGLAVQDVGRTVADCLCRQTGWAIVAGDWMPNERRRAAELTTGRYAGAAWNAKR
jgi:lipoate-protein ligase A